MKILLNGKKVNSEILLVNDGLNYGCFFEHKTEEYELQLSILEFKDLIESDYNKVRDEIRIDDELYKDSSDFTKTNYCSLLELLNFKEDFEIIMSCYFDKILLGKVFKNNVKVKYVINSTDKIKVKNNIIILKGRVFKRPDF